MVQGRQEGGANRRRTARKRTGRLLGCHRISVHSICYESLFIFLARKMDDKMVVLDVRLAKADGLKALEQGNVGLLFGQLAHQAFDALGHGRIGGAIRKQGLRARGCCLRLRQLTFLLKALRFFREGVELGGQPGALRGPVCARSSPGCRPARSRRRARPPRPSASPPGVCAPTFARD